MLKISGATSKKVQIIFVLKLNSLWRKFKEIVKYYGLSFVCYLSLILLFCCMVNVSQTENSFCVSLLENFLYVKVLRGVSISHDLLPAEFLVNMSFFRFCHYNIIFTRVNN